MEELNKTQLVLLALLVSFVTSIATGIVTVALMEQAPRGITQTINRVVERTVEIVQPGEEKVVTYETVVIESEFIKTAVQKNLKGLVIFYAENDTQSREAVGGGFLISADGMAVMDADTLARIIGDDMSAEYNGTTFNVKVFSYEKGSDFAIVHLEIDEENTSIDESFFKPLSFAEEKDVSLGNTVVAVSAMNDIEIASGIVTRLEMEKVVKEGQITVAGGVRYIHTSIGMPIYASGGPLILLDGSVVGMVISTSKELYAIPAFKLKEAFDVMMQQGVETALGNEQAASLLLIKSDIEKPEDQTEQKNEEDNVPSEDLTE